MSQQTDQRRRYELSPQADSRTQKRRTTEAKEYNGKIIIGQKREEKNQYKKRRDEPPQS